jgi:membrane associated rhomboid family serine protease
MTPFNSAIIAGVTPTGPTSAASVERPTLTDAAPGVVIVGVMLAVMWGTEIIDLLPGVALDGWGIRPRTVRGLFGIVFAPFLHAGVGHLIANTIPFAILGAVIALEGTRQIVEVTAMVALVSGAGVWLFGASNSVHLGASGVVFGLITYLVTRGWFAGKPLWILGGLAVAAIYGGTLLWGVVPTGRMSWLGHLFGAIGGVLAAWVMHGQDERDAPAPPTAT